MKVLDETFFHLLFFELVYMPFLPVSVPPVVYGSAYVSLASNGFHDIQCSFHVTLVKYTYVFQSLFLNAHTCGILTALIHT